MDLFSTKIEMQNIPLKFCSHFSKCKADLEAYRHISCPISILSYMSTSAGPLLMLRNPCYPLAVFSGNHPRQVS